MAFNELSHIRNANKTTLTRLACYRTVSHFGNI
jgi:hypothetical protein